MKIHQPLRSRSCNSPYGNCDAGQNYRETEQRIDRRDAEHGINNLGDDVAESVNNTQYQYSDRTARPENFT